LAPDRAAADPGVAGPLARVGRDGALRLAFERRGDASVLTASRSILPLQVLAPIALDDPAAIVSLLNPTGGVLGGDRLAIDVTLADGAHACVTTPSATRIYRSAGEPAVQTARLRLAPGAILEWVPDHTIPSAGAALRQSFDVEVGDGARLILIDAFAAGRVARGEAWRFALLDSTLTVRDARGLLLHDRFVLRGGADWDRLGLAEGRPYFATIVLVAEAGLDAFIADLPGALPTRAATVGAARLPRRGALVRCLATDAPALSMALETVWTLARARLLGLPPLGLRKF
jgi:urease accessory protein